MAVFENWLAKNPENMTVDSGGLQHTTKYRFPVVKTFLSHSSSVICLSPGGKTGWVDKTRFGFESLLINTGCHPHIASGIEDKW